MLLRQAGLGAVPDGRKGCQGFRYVTIPQQNKASISASPSDCKTPSLSLHPQGTLKSAAETALNAGVLGHLWQSVLLTPALVSGPSQLRIAAAHLVHRFVASFLGTTDGHEAVTSLTQKSLTGSKAEFGPEASLVLAVKAGAVGVSAKDGSAGQPRNPGGLMTVSCV